jgi:hypothetical protein
MGGFQALDSSRDYHWFHHRVALQLFCDTVYGSTVECNPYELYFYQYHVAYILLNYFVYICIKCT